MIDEKIIQAMHELKHEPLSASTRASLWQVRDKALARQHEMDETNAFFAGMTLVAQKTNVWSGLGLFAGILLITMVATGNHLLPFSNNAAINQASAIECLTCQLDKVCRL